MKYRLLRFSLLSMLVMLFGGAVFAALLEGSETPEPEVTLDFTDKSKWDIPAAEFKDFAAIVNNQAGTLLTAEEQVQGTAVAFGVAVAENGTVSRVAAEDASSIATISGTYHSDHGLTGMKVVTAVPGPVTLQIGKCTYSGNTIKVTNSAGQEIISYTPQGEQGSGDRVCWKNDRANVIELTYTGEATTLTITGMGYCPFIAVKKYVAPAEFKDFAAIVNNQTGTLLTAEEQVQGTAVAFGVAVAEDGTVSRVAAEDASSIATISGTYHSDHGLTGMKVVTAVPGPVTLQIGKCTYSGNTIKVTNSAGQEVISYTPQGEQGSGDRVCWKNDKKNVIELNYTGEATTLTITGMGYCPYIAVKKSNATAVEVVYSLGEVECEGDILPTGGTYAAGEEYTIPVNNFTLYKEGYTLTGWSDGKNTYAAGEKITLSENITLTPVFTQNEVSLADRTEPVTVKWNFRRDQGAPILNYQNKDGILVAQATIGNSTIDVKMPFTTNNGGKLNNQNNNDCAQCNNNTTFTIPSCKNAVVSMESYGGNYIFKAEGKTATTIDGQSDYEGGQNISYTIGNTAETIDIVMGNDAGYIRTIQVVLPVVQSSSVTQEKAIIDTDFQDWTKSSTTSEITTNFSKENITFTYENTSVDPTATNDGKFNSAEDPAYKGYIMSDKKEATVTTTAFKNITKVRYRHGATGSNRGWGLKMKVGDGEWETINDVTVSSPVWVEKEINKNNVQLQWYNLNTGQNAYMFELEVYANVEITAEQVTLLTAISPGGAGKVTVYPSSETYDKGTEVILTAEDNFGYDFVNWTNAAGEEVSTDAKFKYTVNSNETLTANFVAVETYELALTVDGTNDYMVTVSPAPEVVDGKWMYEAGTAVQLTANQYEGLVTFTNWSDGETNSKKLISMTENTNITAVYAEADIIAGWDFYKAGNNGRKADFYAQNNDADALNLVNTETGETSGWLDKSTVAGGGYEGFKGAAVNWRAGASNGDVGYYHWQTKVNAEAFESINVQFQMLYNFNAYQTYDAECSLDGENWTKFGSITMEGAKKAASFSGKLPADCNNKAELYIRMKADKTSQVDGAASANDGNTLAMFFITGTPKIVDDGKAPVLVSTLPADNATGVSASGKVVLTFDERVKVAEGTVAYINNQVIKSFTQNPTKPTVSGKVVTFEYKGLEYGTKYNFVLAGKTIGDLTDNMIQDAIEISFTTMERPTVEKKLYDAVVENVDQLVAALKAAQERADKNVRYRIFIKNGEYTIPLSSTTKTCNGYDVPECITFINTSNLSIIGESRDGVIITNGIDKNETFAGTYGTTSKYDGIGNSDVFQISGQGYYWQDLTVETGMDDATGRDLAIHDRGTKNIYKNTGLRGYQDTWTSNNDNGLYYFEDGYVRGRTDYMCGKGDAFFNRVELRQIAGGYAAVPSKSIKYGFTYKDCVINGEEAIVDYAKQTKKTAADADGNYTLGRPWGSGTPVALFIDTKMNVVPSAIGWNEMSGGWPKRFAEYNSTTSTGSVIDLSGRKTWWHQGGKEENPTIGEENNPVLTAEEAAEAGNLHNMFGEWDPTLATEQAPLVQDVKLAGNELSWTGSNYALLYAIVKNGEVIGFTTDTTYDISTAAAASRRAGSTDKYQIRAANEMGGLNEASAVATATDGIETVNDNVNVNLNDNIYNLQGIRVNKAQKGVYIIGGRKVVVK